MPNDHATAQSLPDILDAVWSEWTVAKGQMDHPLRLGVLATRTQRGVAQRTLVLRDCDRSSRTLTAFTDIRSEKVREIAAHPQVSWHFYDPRPKAQIRVEGTVSLHIDDDVADACWSAAPKASQINYLEILPPGTPIDAPNSNLPSDAKILLDSDSESDRADDLAQRGRHNFGVLVTVVDQIDWLRLDECGHRRCRFEFDAETHVWRQTWVTP